MANRGTVHVTEMNFNVWSVPQLKEFLKERGITVSGYIKEKLVRLAQCAAELDLKKDPDILEPSESIQQCLERSLKALNFPTKNPFKLKFQHSFENVPRAGILDIFNYLIDEKTD